MSHGSHDIPFGLHCAHGSLHHVTSPHHLQFVVFKLYIHVTAHDNSRCDNRTASIQIHVYTRSLVEIKIKNQKSQAFFS